jgi:thiamine pyrophosphate-dependent acetolactate synthase large subunit-like protein
VNTREVLEAFNRHRGDAPVLVSSGPTDVLWSMGHREPTMYNTGMAYTAPACFGLALARPDLKVIAMEGDGSMLMGLPNFVTIGRYLPRNLVTVVLNNRSYLAVDRGELESASAHRADLAGLARAAGIPHAVATDTPEQFETFFRQAMHEHGPWVVIANVDRTREHPSGTHKPMPDRTELSMLFRRHLAEVRPLPGGESRTLTEGRSAVRPQASGPGRAAARHIYDALKDAGIDLCVYLPETVLYPVQELAEADREMIAVCCQREDEGIAIASGATYGGLSPVVVMEGTGVGLSPLVLAHITTRRIPMLLLTSHTELLGIRAPYNDVAAAVNEPVLRALHLHTVALTRLADARLVIRESVRAAKVLKSPVAVVVPPYLMDEETP